MRDPASPRLPDFHPAPLSLFWRARNCTLVVEEGVGRIGYGEYGPSWCVGGPEVATRTMIAGRYQPKQQLFIAFTATNQLRLTIGHYAYAFIMLTIKWI